jgi:protein-tyrosine-phosphatase
MFEEPAAKKSITVVGAHKPSRNLALAQLLSECIAKHGWSERLVVVAAGVADGAGRASLGDVQMLSRSGVDLDKANCPDFAADPRIVEEADCVVVGSDAEAGIVISWPESAGKQVYALTEFLNEEPSAMDDPAADLAQFVNQVTEAIPHLLRAVVAIRA